MRSGVWLAFQWVKPARAMLISAGIDPRKPGLGLDFHPRTCGSRPKFGLLACAELFRIALATSTGWLKLKLQIARSKSNWPLGWAGWLASSNWLSACDITHHLHKTMIFSSQACHSGCLKVRLRANHEVRRLVGLLMGQTSPRNADFGRNRPLEAGVRVRLSPTHLRRPQMTLFAALFGFSPRCRLPMP